MPIQPTPGTLDALITQASSLESALRTNTHPQAQPWADTVHGVVEAMNVAEQAAQAAAHFTQRQEANPMTTQSGKGITPSGIPKQPRNPNDPNGV